MEKILYDNDSLVFKLVRRSTVLKHKFVHFWQLCVTLGNMIDRKKKAGHLYKEILLVWETEKIQ